MNVFKKYMKIGYEILKKKKKGYGILSYLICFFLIPFYSIKRMRKKEKIIFIKELITYLVIGIFLLICLYGFAKAFFIFFIVGEKSYYGFS